jgi:hypothetical protein
MKILSVSADAKTVKGEKLGYLTGVLYFAPANLSGYEVCPMRSSGCSAACLGWNAGRANIIKHGATTNTIRDSRTAKTRWYFEARDKFMGALVKEIEALIRKAKRQELTPVVRLNGSSDIPWERVPVNGADNIMALFPAITFYDYTKRHNRRNLPTNYSLTYSLAEDNDARAEQAFRNGMNVAAVFFDVPSTFRLGDTLVPVIDGDESDLRFKDPSGAVVGLKAKGDAKNDTSGFVRAMKG